MNAAQVCQKAFTGTGGRAGMQSVFRRRRSPAPLDSLFLLMLFRFPLSLPVFRMPSDSNWKESFCVHWSFLSCESGSFDWLGSAGLGWAWAGLGGFSLSLAVSFAQLTRTAVDSLPIRIARAIVVRATGAVPAALVGAHGASRGEQGHERDDADHEEISRNIELDEGARGGSLALKGNGSAAEFYGEDREYQFWGFG